MSTETDFHALPATTTAGQVMALVAAERILQGNRRLRLVAVPFKGSKPAPVWSSSRGGMMKWLAAVCFALWLISIGVLVLVDLETADKIALVLFSFCSLSVPTGLGLAHLIKTMNPDD